MECYENMPIFKGCIDFINRLNELIAKEDAENEAGGGDGQVAKPKVLGFPKCMGRQTYEDATTALCMERASVITQLWVKTSWEMSSLPSAEDFTLLLERELLATCEGYGENALTTALQNFRPAVLPLTPHSAPVLARCHACQAQRVLCVVCRHVRHRRSAAKGQVKEKIDDGGQGGGEGDDDADDKAEDKKDDAGGRRRRHRRRLDHQRYRSLHSEGAPHRRRCKQPNLPRYLVP